MNRNTKDRRVRKTKKALRDGLATLLAEKNIRDISVQELTDLADLNRATFYLHYKDIYDLQQKIEDEVAEEISGILTLNMPDKQKGPDPLFVELLTYILDNDSLCRMLLGANGNNSFLDKLCAIVEKHCLKYWLEEHQYFNTKEEISYFSSYMIYGYVAVIAKWTNTGMKASPEELAKMMGEIGTSCMMFLKTKPLGV